MKGLVMFALLAAAALLPGAAGAGGWATAGLAPPPDDIAAGDTWLARVTILQHGRTPLAGVEPTVTIRTVKTRRAVTFPGKPTRETGA